MRPLDAIFPFDNPIAGRELRTSLTPRRLAISVTAHTVLLFLATLLASFAQAAITDQLGWVGMMAPFGRALLIVLTVLEILTFTIYVPTRLGAVISSERRHNCLDQLVVTGITPWTLFSGKLVMGLAYAATLLCSSAPFFGICWVFGGVSLSDLGPVYLVLGTYTICLACVTMALSIPVGSVAATLLVVVIGIGLFVTGFAWPQKNNGASACLAPTRFVMVELVGRAHEDAAEEWPRPAFMSTELPVWGLTSLLYLAMGSIAVLSLLIGPSVTFAPGLNSFHSASWVTPRGKTQDSKLLLRSLQHVFLYENSHPSIRRYAHLVRSSVGLAIASFLLWLTASIVWSLAEVPCPWSGNNLDQLRLATLLYAWLALVYLFFVTFCTVCTSAYLRVDQDSRPRSPFALDSLCFLLKLAIPVVIASLMSRPAALSRAFWTTYTVGATYLLTLYVLFANVSLRAQYPPVALSWALGLGIAFTAAPFVWYPLFACDLLPTSIAHIAQASPFLGLLGAAKPGTAIDFTNFLGPNARVVCEWSTSVVTNLAAICLMLPPLVCGLRRARSQT